MPASPSPSSSATDQVCDDQVQAVRAFNRFYTRKLGVLDQQLLKTPFSLSEARVLYELAHGGEQSAKEIGVALGLDAGYLSRIVQNFDESGLIVRKPLATDRRQYQLSLTAKGRQAFAKLDRVTQEDVAAMLRALPAEDRTRLTGAMEAIERLLGLPRTPAPRAILREPRPGDMGWVVQSHGALYASEYGFDSGFEALVAEIVAKYMTSYDGSRERCWIADIEGRPRSARCFWSRRATMSPSCASCCSIRRRAGRASASGWWPNASASHAPAAIGE
ncbi:DNA-binding MarR family transcriptional regulator [Bradyrhizobium sp. LM2.7]